MLRDRWKGEFNPKKRNHDESWRHVELRRGSVGEETVDVFHIL